MRRRTLLAGSVALVATSALTRSLRAQEDEAVPTASQLMAKLDLDALQGQFSESLTALEGERLGGKLVRMVRPLDAEHIRSSLAIAKRSATEIFKHRELSQPFLWSLELDLAVYQSVGMAVDGGRQLVLSAVNNLTSVASDLALKAGMLAATGKGDVEVAVHTFKGGQEEKGCRVYYAPYAHDDLHHRVKFDNFSSPTTDLMPAGKWLIWAHKNKQDGPKDEFRCGDDKRPKRTVHIDAP
jgi:hypothetical protein